MNVLSLFDGLSCGQIALNRANIPYDSYFASEIDTYAIKVAMANYPNTIQLGDVTKVMVENLPKIDLLIGGSPCQSFSNAGKGEGFDGKSGLFWEYVRLLKEVNPTYFLLENVKMKKEWQDIISEAVGVEPITIDSRLVSAQKRNRLYWTNIPNVTLPEDKNIKLKDILLDRNDPLLDVEIPTEARIEYIKRRSNKGWVKNVFNTIDTEKSECIMAVCYKTMKEFVYSDDNGLRFLSCVELERLQTIPDDFTNHVSKSQRRKMIGNGWTVDVIAHIFSHIPLNAEKKIIPLRSIRLTDTYDGIPKGSIIEINGETISEYLGTWTFWGDIYTVRLDKSASVFELV